MKETFRSGSLRLVLASVLCLEGMTSCIFFPSPATPTTSASPTVSASVSSSTVPAGARAVKIFFQTSNSASFNAPTSYTLGTAPAPGSGLQAVRVYNADGSILALNGTTDPNWPGWLTSFEVGVSGSANTAALNPHCANFVNSTESSETRNCLTAASASFACGAPLNQFRVSEYDCTSVSPGNGGGSDGVYFRAVFNRDPSVLGTGENLLVTIEYTASSYNTVPTTPLSCFSGGIFTPESCSDFTWRAYLKHSAAEVIQPFLIVVPPISSSSSVAGTGLSAKQFILPIAADSTLTTFQLSRTGSVLTPTAAFKTNCAGGRTNGDSPLCAGMIFYSITFYRI